MVIKLMFIGAIVIVAFASTIVTTDAYAWDPFGMFKAKENLDEAQKEMERVSIECIQTYGIDQCLLDCSSPEVNNPMLCVKEVNKVNEELTK